MIHCCYLAAGSARRFGQNKLLYPIDGKPMFVYGYHVLQHICESRSDCCLHVISRYEEILTYAGAAAVFCPESVHGMSYSIRAAVAAAGALQPGDTLLFMTADQPYITEPSVLRLIAAAPLLAQTTADAERPLAACAAYENDAGNPVLFSGCLALALNRLRGDQGGKAVLHAYPGRCLHSPVDAAAELRDIDTFLDIP